MEHPTQATEGLHTQTDMWYQQPDVLGSEEHNEWLQRYIELLQANADRGSYESTKELLVLVGLDKEFGWDLYHGRGCGCGSYP
eukprot:COSAG02_NODE_27265_length_613_cov_1.299611_1_plen_83_part_00